MKQLSKSHQKYQGRILSDSIISPQELVLRKTRRDELGRRCREIFEQIRPELIEKYYNWFIAIEANSGDYLIDPTLEGLMQKIRHQYANTEVKLTTFRLNETGACGMI